MHNSDLQTHPIHAQEVLRADRNLSSSQGSCQRRPSSRMVPAKRRVALVCGGTAGHVYPALAVAEAYAQVQTDIDLLFIGTTDSCEARLVPAFGYRFRPIAASKLFGVTGWGKVQAMTNVLRGMYQARRLLRRHQSQLVIGFGGYATAGTLLAARSLGLYTAIHESNIVPGLTNRLLGRIVDRVYLGFAASSPPFAADRTMVTGNPVRSDIARIRKPKPSLDITRPHRILVTGGSQGSAFLNHHVPELLALVSEAGIDLEVWHQVGQHAPEPVRGAYDQAGLSSTVTPYIDAMAAAYRWADFAIACSGAGTIAELSACGLPALLVPLTHVASDHQQVNAEAVAQAGAAWWVSEASWQTAPLANQLGALLRAPDRRFQASTQARRLATENAAEALVAECEALMSRHAEGDI